MCSSVLFLFQDQYDVIEKHTQSGLDLVDRYIKFAKERTEIEQNYAKQLRYAQWFLSQWIRITNVIVALSIYVTVLLSHSYRNLTKKYTKRGNKEEQECKWETNKMPSFHYFSLNSVFQI